MSVNLMATDRFTVKHAAELYGLDAWGNGYLVIREDGHLVVTPERDPRRGIDIYQVIQRLAKEGLRTPILLRFPQLLEAQVRELANAFSRAIQDYSFGGKFLPVYPIKVNQQRPVVEGLLASGRQYGLGLEVGSRAELMLAAALPTPPGSLLICNGYKDVEYLSSAVLAAHWASRSSWCWRSRSNSTRSWNWRRTANRCRRSASVSGSRPVVRGCGRNPGGSPRSSV